MGNGLVQRLQRAGHECFGYDRNVDAVAGIVEAGAIGAGSLEELVNQMVAPRAVWVMVPAAFAGSVVREVAALLEPGDMVIDGGNSNWRDDVDLAEELAPTGVYVVDIGTSGGVHGLERGFSLMIGGPDAAIEHLTPIFEGLSPGIESAERTNDGPGSPRRGWLVALRAKRRWPFCEDGAQRHRVRDDGGHR